MHAFMRVRPSSPWRTVTYVRVCAHMCAHVHMRACVRICEHVYAYVYIYAHTCICEHMYAYVCLCAHMCAYVCICAHMRAYVRIYVHMCACVDVYVCVYASLFPSPQCAMQYMCAQHAHNIYGCMRHVLACVCT